MSTYEGAVLGSIMLNDANYWHVADVLTVDDFSGPVNRRIFAKLAELCQTGKPCDAVTLNDELPEDGDYCYQLANSATPSSSKHYAEKVREESERRKVKAAGQRIAIGEHSYADAQRILADVSPKDTKAIRAIREYLSDFLGVMQKRCEEDGNTTGAPTGLEGLDEVTGGLQPGDLIMVAARPSMGKSAFAMQLALHSACNGGRVGVFSLEMSGVALTARAVSHVGRVEYSAIKNPKTLREEDWSRVVAANEALEASGLVIDETGSQSPESIRARATQLHMQSKLSMIVIDHLGLVDVPKVKGNDASNLGEVTKSFKALAKALGIPVILLVQLNRSLEQRQDKRPMLSDMRDSGRIEEDADVVLMIYRDEYYHEDSQHKGYAELLVRKNREGQLVTVPLRCRLNIMRFEDCDGLPAIIRDSIKPNARFGRFASGKAAAAGDD